MMGARGRAEGNFAVNSVSVYVRALFFYLGNFTVGIITFA